MASENIGELIFRHNEASRAARTAEAQRIDHIEQLLQEISVSGVTVDVTGVSSWTTFITEGSDGKTRHRTRGPSHSIARNTPPEPTSVQGTVDKVDREGLGIKVLNSEESIEAQRKEDRPGSVVLGRVNYFRFSRISAIAIQQEVVTEQ